MKKSLSRNVREAVSVAIGFFVIVGGGFLVLRCLTLLARESGVLEGGFFLLAVPACVLVVGFVLDRTGRWIERCER